VASPRLVTLTLAIEPVDPLTIFHGAGARDRRYWERPAEDFALTGIGTAWPAPGDTAASVKGLKPLLRDLFQSSLAVGPEGPMGAPVLMGAFPFDPERNDPSRFGFTVPAMAVRARHGNSELILSALVSGRDDLDAFPRLAEESAQLLSGSGSELGSLSPPWLIRDAGEFTHWRLMIDSALAEIESGRLRKVVLARRQQLAFEKSPPAAAIIARLRDGYPDTSVFAVAEGTRCFLGASPERLVKVSGGHLFVDCLAGSVPRGHSPSEDARLASELLVDEKNRREHMAVVEFIEASLRPLCSDLTVDSQPSVRAVPNIHHLITRMEGSLRDDDAGVLDVAAALSPTSAMAGIPRAAALDFIREYEGFDRGLYAGGVGWMDLTGDGDIAVGIRSALIEGTRANLYAGCGIVQGSESGDEWAETEWKLMPLRSALGLA